MKKMFAEFLMLVSICLLSSNSLQAEINFPWQLSSTSNSDFAANNSSYWGRSVYVLSDPDIWLDSDQLVASNGLGVMAITVNVFNDYDSDGVDDGAGEPGISGLTVTAFDASNAPTVLADGGNGTYTFTPGNSDVYRIEVTGIPADLEPSVAGATTVFFASVNDVVNVGLHRPSEYYPAATFLATPCYVEGSLGGSNSGRDVMIIVETADLTPGAGNPSPDEYPVAVHSQIGSTFGVAYSRASNSLFASAHMKRHTSFGPGGPGAIYKIDLMGNTPAPPFTGNVVSTFLDLNGLLGNGVAGADPRPSPNNFNRDPTAYDAVGKIGLGGLAMSEDDNVLWTIGLNSRKLYEIPLGGTPANPTAPAAGDIDSWPATGDLTDLPGLPGTAAERDVNIRPFAVKCHRGKIYIGMVYTAESTVVFNAPNSTVSNTGDQSQLQGFVYEFDPDTDVFTQILSFPLDYPREQALDFCSNNGQAEFFPWSPVFDAPVFLAATEATTGSSIPERVYPQPWLVDLEFTEDGRMILGIRDRFADQHGYNQVPPNVNAANDPNIMFTADAAGDILVASLNTTDNTTYVLENNSSNGANGLPFGPTLGENQGEGPGGGEFFFDDRYRPSNAPPDNQFLFMCQLDVNDMDPNLDPGNEQGHDEISLGGIFVHNGQLNVITTVYDPLNDWNLPFNNAGMVRMNTNTGARNGGNQIYATPSDPGTFAKGNGLGDVEGVGGPAPIEIGNRLWLDANNNGRQDADEDGINGVTVRLFKDAGGGTFNEVASTTTAANATQGNGFFIFSSATDPDVQPNMNYEIRVDLADVQGVDNTVTAFTTTGAVTTNDRFTDINDSDASSMGVIAFSTTAGGENNHGLDVGVVAVMAPPCAEKRLDWDVEEWVAGQTRDTFPIGLTTVDIDIQTTGTFDTYTPPGTDPDTGNPFDPVSFPDDRSSFDMAGAMVGDGEGLELSLLPADAMTVSLTFEDPVDGLMFSLLDLDAMESVTITASNGGAAVTPSLSAANPMGPMNVVGNMASGTGINSMNDADGTLDISFGSEVDEVVLTFGSLRRLAISDLKICEEENMSLGNLVWTDLDNDGLRDNDMTQEPGIENVLLKLYKDENADGQPDDGPVDSTLTDPNGYYLFDSLSSGKYLVWIDTINFEPNAVLDSFTTSYFTEIDPDGDRDSIDNGLNDTRKTTPEFGIWSGTVMLVPNNEPLGEADLGPMGNGGVTDENANLTVDFGVLKDSDFDGSANEMEGMGDRDGDGIANMFDFDPAGYVYCQLTGEVVSGGTVEVVSMPAGGAVNFEFDGSSGFYQFFINDVPGVYTIAYTPPPGFSLSSDPSRQEETDGAGPGGSFDPTPGTGNNVAGDDPVILGIGDIDGGTTALDPFTPAANPYYFSFDLNPDPANADPFIFNNNIPLQCACDLEIDQVEVTCDNDTVFMVSGTLDWVEEDPATSGPITVTIGGQSVTIDPGTTQVGEDVPFGPITVNGPAFSTPLVAQFGTNTDCTGERLVDLIACTPTCTDIQDGDDIGGVALNDVNGDGTQQGNDLGQPNVFVEVFDCEGVLVCATYTNENGEWSCPDVDQTNGNEFRVEYTLPLSPELTESFAGPANATSTQFIMAGECNSAYSVTSGNPICDPQFIFTPCYVAGDSDNPDGGDDVFLRFNYDASGDIGSGANAAANKTVLATKDQIGSTWGVAFDYEREQIYASAVLKAQIGMGPEGLGAIYTISPDGSAAPTLLINIPDVGTIPSDAARGLRRPRDRANDFEAVGKIAKVGLGDIDISEDQQTLYVTNLFTREIVVVDIATASVIATVPVPDPGCVDGEYRPWALKVAGNSLYAGLICDGSGGTSNDIEAFVFRMDLGSNVFDGSPVLNFPLNHDRDAAWNSSPTGSARWYRWFADAMFSTWFNQDRLSRPSPILSDIEFDDNGNMILGFIDRSSFQLDKNSRFQTSTGTTNLRFFAAGGDIMRATTNGDGSFTIEPQSFPPVTGNDTSEPEFFFDDRLNDRNHQENSLGGLLAVMGTGEVVTVSYDQFSIYQQGLSVYSTTDGTTNREYVVFEDRNNPNGVDGKGTGLGDLEAFCEFLDLPIQIGNYVWIDEDEDGAQDACEPPIEGLPVTLYTKDDDGTLTEVASTMTGPNGEYYFTGDGTTGEDWDNPGDVVLSDTTYLIVFGDSPETDTTFTFDGTEYAVTQDSTGEGNNPSFNDSDASFVDVDGDLLPAICYTTSDSTDHTLDIGLIQTEVFDLALIKLLDEANTPGPFMPGEMVSFLIKVYNQGDVDAVNVDVTDYPPSGLTFVPGGDFTDATPVATIADLASGDSVMLVINFEVSADALAGDYFNYAEITAADDDNDPMNTPPTDEDSTPGDNQGDDETGTDNDIDDDFPDTPGTVDNPMDSDDYDPAPFRIILDIELCEDDGCSYIADFETDDAGNPLIAGMVDIFNNQPYANLYGPGQGLTFSTNNQAANPLNLYDTDLTGGADSDLEFNSAGTNSWEGGNIFNEMIGNVLIINQNTDLSTPNDFAGGGDIIVDSDLPLGRFAFEMVDMDLPVMASVTYTNTASGTSVTVPFTDFAAGSGTPFEVQGVAYGERTANRIVSVTADLLGLPSFDRITFTLPGQSGAIGVLCATVNQKYDLALIKRIDTTANTGPFEPGDEITFEIEVYNQGFADVVDVEVKDYIPEGLTLAAASTGDWTLSASLDTATLNMPIPMIAAGDSATVGITFFIDSDYMEESLVNTAEISSFDDDGDPTTDPPEDSDSTPNDNGDDDPETDTDDDIDDEGLGTPGTEDNPMDEDDFDPAEVQIMQTFDLALIKQLNTDETPGPFTIGSTVTFRIEVRNQGSLDATDVIVTDYIPDGLSLVISADWNLVMDNAELAMPFDLAAGDTATLSISFTIDSGFSGMEIFNVAEVTQAMNALDLPDEDSTPGDNEGDDPEVDSDDEDDDDGVNGNGMPDDDMDEDDFDFANIEIQFLSLGSTVFVDNNNDGLQNGADAGISGVVVELWNATTNMPLMTGPDGLLGTADDADPTPVTTNGMGNYFFGNLPPGDYFVVIPTAPTATPISSNNTGIAFVETDPDDNVDNDDEGTQAGGAGGAVTSGTVTLSPGDEPENGTGPMDESAQGNMQDDTNDSNGNMTLDFGFFASVTVGDTAFVDVNMDGLQDGGDIGLPNTEVTITDIDSGQPVDTDAEGNPYTPTQMTDSDGAYLFEDLPPGNYKVTFDITNADNSELYVYTSPNAGDDTLDSDVDPTNPDDRMGMTPETGFLLSGQSDITLDAGVSCNIVVEVADPATICSTQPIDLTQGASISPASLGGRWTSDGDGTFDDGAGAFGVATSYTVGPQDRINGSVTLTLTSGVPDPVTGCEPQSAQVIFTVLKVDCGSFFWDGSAGNTPNPPPAAPELPDSDSNE
ncbi:MAG: SdrD B-like domain-containing protein [Bacteroidota bacterium]